MTAVEFLSGNEWVAGVPMPTPRDSHSACQSKDCLYLFGGVTEAGKEGCIDKLTYDSHWVTLAVKMPYETTLASVGFIDAETVMVAGGSAKAHKKPSFTLNVSTGVVTDMPELPEKSLFVSGMYVVWSSRLTVLTDTKAVYQFEASPSESHWELLGKYVESQVQ